MNVSASAAGRALGAVVCSIVLAVFALAAPAATAGVPSAANSTCPSRVTASPDGQCCFDVIVRDLANNPVQGSSVVVSFGACALNFCPTQPAGVLVNAVANTARVLTDATGRARFCVCIRNQVSGCSPSISADGVLLCAALAAESCASDSACVPEQWHAVGGAGPSPRWAAALASDYDYERIVLFGGNTLAGELGDTWMWDGLNWNALSPGTSPGARQGHGMAYDRARRRVVLFGGSVGSSDLGDTWEWDGTTWSLRSTSGPSARRGLGLTYDEARGRIVLFGGRSAGVDQSDTWEWDGSTWTLTASSGPPARTDAGFAYDYASGLCMLYGGSAGGLILGDMWVYTAGAWQQIVQEPVNPGARTGAAMAFSPEGNMMVLCGGYGSDLSTWAWHGGHWVESLPGTGFRLQGSLAYDHFNDHILVFGGLDGAPVVLQPRGDTQEWCSPCPFVSALLDTLGQLIPPANADPEAWGNETPGDTPPSPVAGLHPQFDTSVDNWQSDYPCDPAFGTEEPLDLDILPELRDSLETPGFTEAEFADSLAAWEARVQQMLDNEPAAFSDTTLSIGTYSSPTKSHCPDPTKRYAFGGRDIVFIHGLRMTPLKHRMFGINDTAFVDWQPPNGAPGNTVNPDYYYDDRYWKRGANNYWKPHIDRFLRAKGYANRFLVVAWPSTQRYETAVNAVLSQIYDAMRFGTGVVDSLSGNNDVTKFGTPDFVIISHSTGGPVTDVTLSAAAHFPWLQAKFISDRCKAHIAIQGAFSGSAIAATAVGAGMVASANTPVWLCKLLEEIFESNVPVCHNIAYLDTPVRGVTFDLSPNVSQLKWGPYMNSVTTRTVTVTGGHPSFQWPLKWLLLRGLDDGVLTTNSTSGNPNSRQFWPSGYIRLGPLRVSGAAVEDMGLKSGFKVRRMRGYVHDQLLDPLRLLDPVNLVFPPPLFTRVASGCTDGLSPSGMVQPWHLKPIGGLIDPNKRYDNHFSFIEAASDHYGMTPNATDDVRDAGAIRQLQVFFPDNDYERTFSLAGTEHNKEEVRVINDEAIYDSYTIAGDPAPLLDKQNAAVAAGISVVEDQKSKCFPKRKSKPCKIYRWRRTYNRLAGWENKLAADYVYDYLLTQPAELCAFTSVPGDEASGAFFARSVGNPFRRELAVEFRLPRAAMVSLEVFDMLGRRVRAGIPERFTPGLHQLVWDAHRDGGALAQPGVYLWRLRVDGQRMASEKAVLVR